MGPRTAVVLEGVPKAVHRVQHKVGYRAHLAEVVRNNTSQPVQGAQLGCRQNNAWAQGLLGSWVPTPDCL